MRVQRGHLDVADRRPIGAQPLYDLAVHRGSTTLPNEVQRRLQQLAAASVVQSNEVGEQRVSSGFAEARVWNSGVQPPVEDQHDRTTGFDVFNAQALLTRQSRCPHAGGGVQQKQRALALFGDAFAQVEHVPDRQILPVRLRKWKRGPMRQDSHACKAIGDCLVDGIDVELPRSTVNPSVDTRDLDAPVVRIACCQSKGIGKGIDFAQRVRLVACSLIPDQPLEDPVAVRVTVERSNRIGGAEIFAGGV